MWARVCQARLPQPQKTENKVMRVGRGNGFCTLKEFGNYLAITCLENRLLYSILYSG
jgi:hypothetical protein